MGTQKSDTSQWFWDAVLSLLSTEGFLPATSCCLLPTDSIWTQKNEATLSNQTLASSQLNFGEIDLVT